MTQSVMILGRQPALGMAELESLFGSEKVAVIGTQAALVDLDPSEVPFDRLGGTIKLGMLLTKLDTTEWAEIAKWLVKTVPEHLQYLPEGKLQLGLSTYGMGVSVAKLNASGLELKKVIRATGRSVRLIPNKAPELNSAQVLHNHLAGPLGWEFLFICDGKRTHVAQTLAVQDIEAYAARDQVRPKRDARVGMLPPKLAQIIVNLAVGQLADGSWQMVAGEDTILPTTYHLPSTTYHLPPTILDPFCGTGVVLQEALLMGYTAYGSDLEPRMIEYSQTNLDWLSKIYNLQPITYNLQQADATNYTWKPFGSIACETYLGRPFSALPNSSILNEVIQDVNTIHRKFLRNIARQTKSGFRMCIAVPAWRSRNSEAGIQNSDIKLQTSAFRHLPVLDQLTDLGYNRISFQRVNNRDLIYHRPEQIVARELIVLQRK